jgi:hypothetical protein
MDLPSRTSKYYDRLGSINNAATVYGQHFKMHISLAHEDTTHCREGYRIEIIVKIIDAPEWSELLISVLLENNIPFRRIV